MTIRKCSLTVAVASIFGIAIFLVGSAPSATAETLNLKMFNHVTKAEMLPVGDVEGHVVGVMLREGATVLPNGEWAWHKIIQSFDMTKGAGTLESYLTLTFLDGSTFIVHTKGTVEATPQGVASAAKITGDIIRGSGRFQGIKGTATISAKLLPPEKGEQGQKSLGEVTVVYTLPGK